MAVLLVIAFILRLAFIPFQALLLRRSREEREFYNDVLEKVEQEKYAEIPNLPSWLGEFPRVAIEGLFAILLVLSMFELDGFNKSGAVLVFLYLGLTYLIYKKRPGRLFTTNDVLKLNALRLLFAILSCFF